MASFSSSHCFWIFVQVVKEIHILQREFFCTKTTQQLHSSPLHSQFLCKVVKLTQPCRQIFLYENTTTKAWLSLPCDLHILFNWRNSHNPAAKYFMWKHNKILILLTPSFPVFQVVTLLFQRLLKIGNLNHHRKTPSNQAWLHHWFLYSQLLIIIGFPL